jgi:hypothetical protein
MRRKRTEQGDDPRAVSKIRQSVLRERSKKRFPPSRPEDLVIMLLPDAPKTINCKTYKLMAEETKSMRMFLMEQ